MWIYVTMFYLTKDEVIQLRAEIEDAKTPLLKRLKKELSK